MCPCIVEYLVQSDAGEIRKLHFHNRPHSLHRSADGSTHDCILTDRRIQNAPRKFLRQSFRCFKSTAKCPTDVLSVNENAIVSTQELCLRFADRLEISQAHEFAA